MSVIIAVLADEVRELGGNAAIMLQQIRYTAQLDQDPVKEGWTPMPLVKASEVTGLSVKSCRTAIKKLLEMGWLESDKLMQHRGDQTLYFHLPLWANAFAPMGNSSDAHTGNSSDAHTGNSTITSKRIKKREEVGADAPPPVVVEADPVVEGLCELLRDEMIAARTKFDLSPAKPKIGTKWHRDMRLLLERGDPSNEPDSIDPQRVERVIRAIYANESWWCKNIQSPAALRKYWQRVVDELNRDRKKVNGATSNIAEARRLRDAIKGSL